MADSIGGNLLEDIRARLHSPVAVLCGGDAAEREVSLKSGRACCDALLAAGVDARLIDTRGDWLGRLQRAGIRHSFLALHGTGGEDGTVQGALSCLGVSYTGSGVLASALAMDKWRCKLLWRALGLPTPPAEMLRPDSDWAAVIEALGGRVIVKPVHEGSSIGMSVAESAAELREAYLAASRYDAEVFAERWIAGAEFTVAVLGDDALPVIRLETAHTFYDFDAKYVSDQTRYLIPCGLAQSAEESIRALALTAYRSLGCVGWGRVDVLQDAGGEFQLLEVNTIPGMTDHSLVPMAAAAAGMSFGELVLRILALSLQPGGAAR